MKQVRLADLAERDLDEIWSYVVNRSQSIDIADRVVESIADCFSLFAHTPEAGTHRDDVEPGIRGFASGNYVIYYRETRDYVVISRVLHGMRDQKATYKSKD